jgi:hypothetical protein
MHVIVCISIAIILLLNSIPNLFVQTSVNLNSHCGIITKSASMSIMFKHLNSTIIWVYVYENF